MITHRTEESETSSNVDTMSVVTLYMKLKCVN